MKYKFSIRSQRGVVAIITVLFITFLASIVIALAAIILPRLRVSAEIKRSVGALYAADSALEWCLYRGAKAIVPGPDMQNGATYVVYLSGTTTSPTPSPSGATTDCSTPGGPPIKSIGTYQGVTRSFEISGFY